MLSLFFSPRASSLVIRFRLMRWLVSYGPFYSQKSVTYHLDYIGPLTLDMPTVQPASQNLPSAKVAIILILCYKHSNPNWILGVWLLPPYLSVFRYQEAASNLFMMILSLKLILVSGPPPSWILRPFLCYQTC
jgi:hypothetical protein